MGLKTGRQTGCNLGRYESNRGITYMKSKCKTLSLRSSCLLCCSCMCTLMGPKLIVGYPCTNGTVSISSYLSLKVP
jgi:hypothetical protein